MLYTLTLVRLEKMYIIRERLKQDHSGLISLVTAILGPEKVSEQINWPHIFRTVLIRILLALLCWCPDSQTPQRDTALSQAGISDLLSGLRQTYHILILNKLFSLSY